MLSSLPMTSSCKNCLSCNSSCLSCNRSRFWPTTSVSDPDFRYSSISITVGRRLASILCCCCSVSISISHSDDDGDDDDDDVDVVEVVVDDVGDDNDDGDDSNGD